MISYAIQIRLGAVWCGAEKKLSLRGEMRMRELNYFSTIQSIQQVRFNHAPFHRSFGCKNRIIDIIFYSTVSQQLLQRSSGNKLSLRSISSRNLSSAGIVPVS
mmetsp:Transcript_11460/g.17410  ORF Transcript_11460/g.17410 Transcript_11460/m.17410 type:complete len:103 (-) Transcript_11460:1491-1799(-)